MFAKSPFVIAFNHLPVDTPDHPLPVAVAVRDDRQKIVQQSKAEHRTIRIIRRVSFVSFYVLVLRAEKA